MVTLFFKSLKSVPQQQNYQKQISTNEFHSTISQKMNVVLVMKPFLRLATFCPFITRPLTMRIKHNVAHLWYMDQCCLWCISKVLQYSRLFVRKFENPSEVTFKTLCTMGYHYMTNTHLFAKVFLHRCLLLFRHFQFLQNIHFHYFRLY